jgi:hypothetical protein
VQSREELDSPRPHNTPELHVGPRFGGCATNEPRELRERAQHNVRTPNPDPHLILRIIIILHIS